MPNSWPLTGDEAGESLRRASRCAFAVTSAGFASGCGCGGDGMGVGVGVKAATSNCGLGALMDSFVGTVQSGAGGASLGEMMSTVIASVASESNGFAPVNSTASSSAPP